MKSFSHSSSFTVVARMIVPAENNVFVTQEWKSAQFLFCEDNGHFTVQGEKTMGPRVFGWNAHFSCYHSSTYVQLLPPPPPHTHTHTHTHTHLLQRSSSQCHMIVALCFSVAQDRQTSLRTACGHVAWQPGRRGTIRC